MPWALGQDHHRGSEWPSALRVSLFSPKHTALENSGNCHSRHRTSHLISFLTSLSSTQKLVENEGKLSGCGVKAILGSLSTQTEGVLWVLGPGLTTLALR